MSTRAQVGHAGDVGVDQSPLMDVTPSLGGRTPKPNDVAPI
jgi:hypothetical protein